MINFDILNIKNYSQFDVEFERIKTEFNELKLLKVEELYQLTLNSKISYDSQISNFKGPTDSKQYKNLILLQISWNNRAKHLEKNSPWLINSDLRPNSSTMTLLPEEQEAFNKLYTDKKKELRNILVSNIVVEVEGMELNGDEISQTRMTRAITALPDDTTTISWTLYNNTIGQLTRPQLQQALFLAGQRQTELWNIT